MTAASELYFSFQPELDGPHKYQLMKGLPSHFAQLFTDSATAAMHRDIWTSFTKIYEILHKVSSLSLLLCECLYIYI